MAPLKSDKFTFTFARRRSKHDSKFRVTGYVLNLIWISFIRCHAQLDVRALKLRDLALQPSYGSIITVYLKLRHKMWASGYCPTSAALKTALASIWLQKPAWAPKPIWMWWRTETSPNPPRIKPQTYGHTSYILITVVVELPAFDLQADTVNDTTCDNKHTVLNISIAITILYVMTWRNSSYWESPHVNLQRLSTTITISPHYHTVPILKKLYC